MEHKSTILIVDDEAVGRRTLEALLFNQGYDLAFAEDGPQALAKAAQLLPDLILLDVMMPRMDGFEVCRRLRADPLLAEAPIILVTALDDYDSRLQGLEAGADDFVSKPFDRAELQARVRTTTRLNRYRRLLTERARFEWVVEQADDGYLIVDDKAKVLYANAQARLYLGLAPATSEGDGKDAAISETFPELVKKLYHCEPQKVWSTWIMETSEAFSPTPQASCYLVQPETSTAHAFWLRADVLLGQPSGAGADWVVRLRDATEQMSLRRDMHGFHEMITHKLRTPLTNTLGSLELLAQYAPKMSRDDIVQFSETAFKSIQRLHGEIEDVMQYLNISDVGRPDAGFRLSQLESLVAKVGAGLGIESVAVSGGEELGDARTLLSRRGIELMLWEIFENAKKFHPEQAPTVQVELAPQDSHRVRIKVSDDGLTLSPEQLAQMWKPYYQSEKDFTGQVPGMGLGLSMVAALVWEVGGTCQVYNQQDGPGIVVELVLPLAGDDGGTRERILG